MLIDKIKSFGQSLETKKASQSKSLNDRTQNDNIEISDAAKVKATEAKLLADVKTITEHTLSMPVDSERALRIQEIKAKLQRGDYDNPSTEMLNAIADRFVSESFRSEES